MKAPIIGFATILAAVWGLCPLPARAADIKRIEINLVSQFQTSKFSSDESNDFVPSDSGTTDETITLELVTMGKRKLYSLQYGPADFGCSIDGQSMSVQPLISVGGEYKKNFNCEFDTTGTKIEVELESSSTFANNRMNVTGRMGIHGRQNTNYDEWWFTDFSLDLFVLGDECRVENLIMSYSNYNYKEWKSGLLTQWKKETSTKSFDKVCVSSEEY